jgi:hypothetical protein
MRHLQPTVRQLQPLGRRHDSAPVMQEKVDPRVREAETSSPDLITSAPPRLRRWRRLTARARPSS